MEKSVDEKSDSKFSFIFTKKFLIILLLGQFLSLCITATTVTNTELAVNEGVNFPTTQSCLNYLVLNVVYTSITIWKAGWKGWLKILKNRGWMYAILALIDVEGNYFVVKAYQYTSLLSAMLLDNWSTIVCMILLMVFFRVRYHWSQYLGALLCFGGIGVLLRGDINNNKDIITPYTDMLKGDLFLLLGSTLYGFSNVGEQYLVRKYPLYEVVGQLGFFATIINGIQLAILERDELKNTHWNGRIVGLLIAFNIAMFCLYTGAPQLFRISSATFFNLSLITSDFYGLIFALFLFDQKMHGLYPLAYIMSIGGLIVYHIYPESDPQPRKPTDEESPEPRSDQANDIVAKD
ncbi:10399_t:CDS:2 [Paraglomus brasilianum]|uniref:10399_t:CDS:1 n=1 Tax=Paraglomus brasilianum TaxID=144538 RepID=A0A9N9G332_9GLOM|nr:10399_t:CDS:2 [Paraglomus brasilianum]